MGRKKKEKRKGYGMLLDAWVPPDGAGDPVGCVATSFTFSPVFFEEECLGRFLQLETDATEDGPLYLIEREEKLSQVVCAAALVDKHHCKGSRSLRWDMLPARIPKGVLHAKVSLLYWSQLVRLIVASANLTEDGYRRNREVYGVVDFRPTGSESEIGLLLRIMDFLREAAAYSSRGSTVPPALQRWNSFLDRTRAVADEWGIPTSVNRHKAVSVQCVLTGPGRISVMETLASAWPGGGPPHTGGVYSPFFDTGGGRNTPAEELWSLLRRRGSAETAFHLTAEEIPDSDKLLVHAPESLRKAEPTGRSAIKTTFHRINDENGRPFHAKGLWLHSDRWVAYLVGSSNFTTMGLGLDANAKNLEANLLYTADHVRHRAAWRAFMHGFPRGTEIKTEQIGKWLGRSDDDSASEQDIALHEAFGSATYECGKEQAAEVSLSFQGDPPSEWEVLTDVDDEIFYSEESWHKEGRPGEVRLSWQSSRAPSGFWVRWKGADGRAWWPANVASMSALPPPEELRDLPLEVLMSILTSSRSLHVVLRDYLKGRDKASGQQVDNEIVDPHKKVDTSQFLLQRTRRVSAALCALRERLERPVANETCLNWRLHGPVGVMAFKDALIRDAQRNESEEEAAFLLSELALELARCQPKTALGYMSAAHVGKAIRAAIPEIRKGLRESPENVADNLKEYVDSVFEVVES